MVSLTLYPKQKQKQVTPFENLLTIIKKPDFFLFLISITQKFSLLISLCSADKRKYKSWKEFINIKSKRNQIELESIPFIAVLNILILS